MINFISWYILITLLGLLTFPLAYRLLPGLPDRGYALSRTLGLLLWGFVFWLAVSLGVARNDLGGLFATLIAFAFFSLWWGSDDEDPATPHRLPSIRAGLGSAFGWIKEHWGYTLLVEALFLLAFAGLAFVRANAPEALGTEKPMELAFINAVLRSETFPPNDPWLSGYGISYYYFGYVMTGMIAKMTATLGGVAFNLMIALVFGLSAIGAYGILYNLLSVYRRKHPALLTGLFGPLFLLIISNLEGFLELLHRQGIGWTFAADGSASGPFWTWLHMKDLSSAPIQPLGGIPERFWWWWRAARVLHDYDLADVFTEVIDEFPFFSYLLADLHPHVLAMPFGLLSLALALHLYLGGWQGEISLRWFKLPLAPRGFVVLAITLGGLAFLNTWDLPVFLALTGLGLVLRRIQQLGWNWTRLEELVVFGLTLGLTAIVLYFPFYASFSSQAGGILPNVVFPTRGAYLWIMFGALFVPLFLFLWHLREQIPANWSLGFGLSLGLTLALWLLSVVFGVLLGNVEIGRQFITSQGATGTLDVLIAATQRRFEFFGGMLTLVLLLGLAAAYLTATRSKAESAVDEEVYLPEAAIQAQSVEGIVSPVPFLLLMVLLGGLLVLAPEFIYLRDGFGSRMNTIFKFYYQAWTLWSLVSAFGFVIILTEARGVWGVLARGALLLVMAMGLVYPVLSLPNRANYFKTDPQTLDAGEYLAHYSPEDAAVVEFLRGQPFGVIAEAVGGSYSEYGRMATHTGLQNVQGWGWHEWQWRGSDKAFAGRENDIRRLYESASWNETAEILKRYNVRYLVVGNLERNTYHVNEFKFENITEIFRMGNTVVYLVPEMP